MRSSPILLVPGMTLLASALLWGGPGSRPALASDLGTRIRGVQQIAEDTIPPTPECAATPIEVEPAVSLDPLDPEIVVAVFQEGRCTVTGGALGIGYATSHDGGRT